MSQKSENQFSNHIPQSPSRPVVWSPSRPAAQPLAAWPLNRLAVIGQLAARPPGRSTAQPPGRSAGQPFGRLAALLGRSASWPPRRSDARPPGRPATWALGRFNARPVGALAARPPSRLLAEPPSRLAAPKTQNQLPKVKKIISQKSTKSSPKSQKHHLPKVIWEMI